MKHFLPGPMSRLSSIVLVLPLALAGCATVSDAPQQQQLELHAVLDHQEIGGVGCLLSNDLGRWFVVAPGRVTVARSTAPLTVSCKKEGAGMAHDVVGARADLMSLMGNVVITAGLGHLVDRYTGAGFSYPANLTVLMAPAKGKDALVMEQRVGNAVF